MRKKEIEARELRIKQLLEQGVNPYHIEERTGASGSVIHRIQHKYAFSIGPNRREEYDKIRRSNNVWTNKERTAVES
jgi:uncharacterized protein YerC